MYNSPPDHNHNDDYDDDCDDNSPFSCWKPAPPNSVPEPTGRRHFQWEHDRHHHHHHHQHYQWWPPTTEEVSWVVLRIIRSQSLSVKLPIHLVPTILVKMMEKWLSCKSKTITIAQSSITIIMIIFIWCRGAVVKNSRLHYMHSSELHRPWAKCLGFSTTIIITMVMISISFTSHLNF